MATKYELKMAVVSGAHHALDYKDKHPRATNQEILKYVAEEALNIISKIDKK